MRGKPSRISKVSIREEILVPMADGEKWLRRDAVDDVIGLLLQLLADFGRCRRDRYDDPGRLQLALGGIPGSTPRQ